MKKFLILLVLVTLLFASCGGAMTAMSEGAIMDGTFLPPGSTNVSKVKDFWYKFDYNGKHWYAFYKVGAYDTNVEFIERSE